MNPESKWNADAPLVVAHRGASLYAPENTLAAFRLAVTLKADAIELDAQLTKDGQIVVLHDHTLDRTTSGKGHLASKNLHEIRDLEAGLYFNPEFVEERIPTLEEVFKEIGHQLLINIELKNYANPFDPLPEMVVKLIRSFGLEQEVLLSSFNPIALMKVKKLFPEIPLGLLIGADEPGWLRFVFRLLAPHEALHPSASLAIKELIEDQHSTGRKVIVWTVNDQEQIKTLLFLGVDGIITDAPDVAREVVLGVLSERSYTSRN